MVERLKKAAAGRWEIIAENQAMGGEGTLLRPDLAIKKNKDIILIDVTIPFENGLVVARKKKIEKYEPLVRIFNGQGYNTKVETVIVGALRSWDPKNDGVIRRICSEKYARIMRKVMVSETISYSQDIVFEHTYRVPQDSHGRQM